jgi:hypothetical protein
VTKTQILIGLIFVLLISSYTVEGIVHIPPKKIKAPEDLTYTLGSTGNTLTWQYDADESGDIPGTYTVTIDDNPLMGHTDADWEDLTDIVVNVDGLSMGQHTVVMSITDHDTGQ